MTWLVQSEAAPAPLGEVRPCRICPAISRTRHRLRYGAGPYQSSRQRELPRQLFFVKKDWTPLL